MRVKRVCLVLLISALATSTAFAGTSYRDTNGHWAEAGINKMSGYKLISGYNGLFRPNDSISRGEMAVIVDNIMGYHTKSDKRFSDLDNGYYADAVKRANNAGVINGAGSMVRPKEFITRQEAAVMLCRAFHVEVSGTSTGFRDNEDIAEWAKPSVKTMESKGFMKGDANRRFNPLSPISRAEVTQVVANMMDMFINEGKSYSGDSKSNAIVKTGGAEIANSNISGDLIVAEGVKDGTLVLNGAKVRGNMVVKGGSSKSNAITIKNGSSVNGKVLMDKGQADTFMEIASNSVVNLLEVKSGSTVKVKGELRELLMNCYGTSYEQMGGLLRTAKVNTSNNTITLTHGKIENITGLEGQSNLRITSERDTDIGRVQLDSNGNRLSINGDVGSISTGKNSYDTSISANSYSEIKNITLYGKNSTVSGNGVVKRVDIKADNCEVKTSDTEVRVDSGVYGTVVNGKEVKGGVSVNSSKVDELLDDEDDRVYKRIGIDDVEQVDINTLKITLSEKTPNTLSESKFKVVATDKGNNASVDRVTTQSGSKKNRVYEVRVSGLNGNRYEVKITLPLNKDSREIRSSFNNRYYQDYKYPTITNIKGVRESATTALIDYTASDKGKLFYVVTEKGSAAPPLSQVKSGTSVNISNGAGYIRYSGLMDGKEHELYYVTYNSDYSPVSSPVQIAKNTPVIINGIEEFKLIKGTVNGTFKLKTAITSELTASSIRVTQIPTGQIGGTSVDYEVVSVSSSDKQNYSLTLKTVPVAGLYSIAVTVDKLTYNNIFSIAEEPPVLTNVEFQRLDAKKVQVKFRCNADAQFKCKIGKGLSSSNTKVEDIISTSDHSVDVINGNNSVKVDIIEVDGHNSIVFVVVRGKLVSVVQESGVIANYPLD